MDNHKKEQMTLLRVSTKNGLFFLYIMRNADTNKYHFVDFTNNCIYSNEYDSIDEAISIIENKKSQGIILWYQSI